MGSPEGEVGRAEAQELYYQNLGIDYSETQHQVKVSDFSMSKYAVTVAGFRRFTEATGYRTDAEQEGFSVVYLGNNEGGFQNGVNWRHGIRGLLRPSSEDNHPVVHVSWNDAVAYCAWMSKQTGNKYRLPTEAEREYACRAGTTTPFGTGGGLTTDQANVDGNSPSGYKPQGDSRQNTVPVNSFVPNALGLYNMHGNVAEWCSDWFGERYYEECKASGTVTNPPGPSTGSDRVLRGGSWNRPAMFCRSALRHYFAPDYRNAYIGLRLVFVP